MRTLLAASIAISGCAGDARHVQVELDVRTEPCDDHPSKCTVHLVGSGLIFTAGSETSDAEAGSDALYAEIETSSGALTLIEIVEDEIGSRTIRYREVRDGEVTLATRVENARVKAPAVGQWTFAFAAYDEDGSEADGPVRVIEDGRVIPLDGDVTPVEMPAPRPTRRQSDDNPDETDTHVVIVIDDDVGCGGPDDEPPPQPEDPRRRRPRPEPEPEVDSGGCDGGDTSGCDADTGSSSSCEGDSSGGGCDDSSSSGCEGDTSSSAADCDSCEGDIALGADGRPQHRRAILSMLRLAWPVWLAAWFNRRKKRRSLERLQCRLLDEARAPARSDAG